jgi:hypothetical protein
MSKLRDFIGLQIQVAACYMMSYGGHFGDWLGDKVYVGGGRVRGF